MNVFSFCLYGPETPKYYHGLLENIVLAGIYFPTWKVYVYLGADVTESMRSQLEVCSSVVIRDTGLRGAINMIHRFFAIDDPEVELMMVRDADSRIHWKDRWAIREFVRQPQFVAHTIRDHKEHTAKLMGGLWGIRKSAGLVVQDEYASYVEDDTQGWRYAHDQNFLSDVLYGKVVDRLLTHYSNGRRNTGELAVEFPFDWSPDVFCGRVEDHYIEQPQPPVVARGLQLPIGHLRLEYPSDPPPPVEVPVPVRLSIVPSIITFLHKK